ncbi:methylated-DNA--[protein]-cysteine S-methyltransferase [Pseudonocardia petroleophila]|uniref:methylated-DNA--[protein]-cysteine S-methyltransferase n=2 Tax=Pseudonocardia petroleophila TaxID=37331 RepID=A0A7G7MRP2_9PSEU|nr:methylated-DNA--[protein]-cysteine S-methyltransferase [Pseudonocardia petroleophila]
MGALTLGVTAAGLALVVFGDDRAAAARAADRLGARVVDSADTEAHTQVAEYLAGARRAFTTPLDWSLASGLQRRVLGSLFATVPFGATVTYGQLATRSGLGNPRGVGSVMGSNPIPVVVPCHRVLGADGLGGFGGGRATKEWLLALEGVLPSALEFT